MSRDSSLAGRGRSRFPPWGRPAAGLLILLAAVWWSLPKVLSPRWVFFSRDISGYWYAMVATYVRVIAEGTWPLWDPYEAYGLPLWADPGSQVAYPPTWLNLLLLPHTVYKLVVLGHLVGGGAGVFVLLRRFRMGVLPASAASVAFACSGPLMSAGSLIHHLCGAAWMGWVLWAFEGVLERAARRDVALLALTLGVQALAGSAETCAMTCLAALLRWATLAAGHWGRAVRRAAPLAAAAGVATLVMAIQWLPTLALLGRTNRMHILPESRLVWSAHPATLVDAFVPRLIAEISMGERARAALYDGREPFLLSLYLGAATLPLVLLALRSQRPQRTWAWLTLALFASLSLGRHLAPATAVLGLPPLSFLRYPSKYLWGAAFAWAVLTGLGIEVWWRAWRRPDRTWGAVVGGASLAGGLTLAVVARIVLSSPQAMIGAFDIAEPWREWMALLASRKLAAAAAWLSIAALLLLLRAWRPGWSRGSAVAATLLAAADLATSARPVNPLAPVELMTHRPPLLDDLLADRERTRVLSRSDPVGRLNQDLTRGPAGWEPEWRWTLGMQEMISPPSGARWNLRGSYDGDFTGLGPPWLSFMTHLVVATQGTPVGLRLLQMGNVGWVIDARSDGFSLLPQVAESPSVFSRPLRLRRVPDPLPPCYVVGAATRASSDEAAARRIASSDFDPWREAVLAGEGPGLEASAAFRGTALYQVRSPNLLRIETEANAPGVLVLTEAFDPDWRASIDGVPVPVERANVLFRGVQIPPGRHRVELTYFPASIRWGMGATGLGLVLAGVLLRTGDRRLLGGPA